MSEISAGTLVDGRVSDLPSPLRFGLAPWLYLAPAVVTIVAWTYLPLVEAFQLSFFQWNMLPTSPRRFVGLDNYADLLTLPEMRIALWNTAIYIIGLFPMSVIIPLAVAIFTQDLKGPMRNVYRTLIFIPMIIAPVVAAIVWRWLLNEDHGLINVALDTLGLGRIGFLQDPNFALATLIWITGWKLIGFSTLLFSDANAGINPSYYALKGGGQTRWRSILRGGALHDLSENAQGDLVRSGLGTVIDLRSGPELSAAPNPFRAHWDVVYHNIPLFGALSPLHMYHDLAKGERFDMSARYRDAIDRCQPAISRVILTIAGAGEGTVLFHCSAGKDRTGIIALSSWPPLEPMRLSSSRITLLRKPSRRHLSRGCDWKRWRVERIPILWIDISPASRS